MKSMLNHPSVYLLYHWLIGGKQARKVCIDRYVKPRPGERVLDVGCGPGFVVDYLPDVEYVGIDVDQRYIEYAQARYGDRAEFHCEELRHENVDQFGQFDIILLNGLLHHLDDPSLIDLLTLLSKCLDPHGRLMTLDGCFRNNMSPVSRFLMRHDRGQFIRYGDQYRHLAGTVFADVEMHQQRDLFYIPYDIVVMICRHKSASSGGDPSANMPHAA